MRVTSAAYLSASAACIAAALLAPRATLAISSHDVDLVMAGRDQQQRTSNEDARLRHSNREKKALGQQGMLSKGGKRRRLSSTVDTISATLRQGVLSSKIRMLFR